jgi:hypothetical protein
MKRKTLTPSTGGTGCSCPSCGPHSSKAKATCSCQKCPCGTAEEKFPKPSGGPSETAAKKSKGDPEGTAAGWASESIGEGLEIKPVPTSKDKIEQPFLAKDERKIIPPIGSSVIICGKSGSGKSTLLQNLLCDPRFYGKSNLKPEGWFNKTFLFAPTGGSDDILKALNIPERHVFTDMSEAPAFLKVIQDSQGRKLKGGGKAHLVEQICVIFEDVIGETQFMNTPEFKRMFYMVRHLGATTFICAQHFHRVPKVCRLQASFIAFFAGSAQEVEIIAEMYAPPMYSKKEFIEMVNDATREDFDFLGICMKVGWKYRFRRNLDNFYTLHRLASRESEDKKPPEKKEEKEEPKGDEGDEDFSAKKMQEGLLKIVQQKKSRDVRANEQASKICSQWAYAGPRGRTIW